MCKPPRGEQKPERLIPMEPYVEHANITVLDLDEAVKFITTAFPHFEVRGDGEENHGDWKLKWLHVGTDDTYIAFMTTDVAASSDRKPQDATGMNHVGFVIDDTEAMKERMVAAGYKAGYATPHHPCRKRLYVTDPTGLSWEFVQYLSDDPAERNDYKL